MNNEPVQREQQYQYEQPVQTAAPQLQHQSQNRYNEKQFIYQNPVNTYQQPTTTITPRIYPPGKLSLNRTPDGFSYSFNKI